MARGNFSVEQSDFEKQRLANIAERDVLLKKLTQEAQQAGLISKPQVQNGVKRAAAKKKAPPAKRLKREEDLTPRRTSSRLKGIRPDSEVAQKKAEEEYEAAKEAEKTRRQRRTGDLALGDIMVNGDTKILFGADPVLRQAAVPYERTFGEDDIQQTTDKNLKILRERMRSMQLWETFEPNRIKIVPERIYSASFHPTTSKPIVFMGDKMGNLGIIDASQEPSMVKEEDSDDDGDGDDPDPVMTTLKPHTRTISAMHTHLHKPESLVTSSYDSSIRSLDLEKSVSTEIYGPVDSGEDEPISGIDMSAEDPNVVYFTTLNGRFGKYDVREKASKVELYQLSEKKIGGFSLNPTVPHYLATASLDRYLRIWDLRKMTKKLPTLVGEHESRLSVSHAAFNEIGQVATTSYDDTIKVHSFGVSGTSPVERRYKWRVGHQLEESAMKPEVIIRHNNQVGRWVTIFRPVWQQHPRDGVQKLCVGNMNRFVDVYSADGNMLAQLGGDFITAVPAVAVFHPSEDWIAAGTASGKLCLWK